MCDMPAPSAKQSKEQQDYRAEDDFRTMQRAEEVRGDSARHTRALAHGRKQLGAITKVMGGMRKIGPKVGRQPKRAPSRG